MKRSKLDAKDWSTEHVKGIFGAAPVPYHPGGEIDEDGFRANLRYWRDVLQIKGQWVAGFQSEQLGISTAQRKRLFEIAQEESQGKQIAICAVMDDVIEDAPPVRLSFHSSATIANPPNGPANHNGFSQDPYLVPQL